MEQHLRGLGSKLVIKEEEKAKITTSIETIKERVKKWFGNEITGIEIFGSYSRDTILPRKVDEGSDIDVMIIFKNEENYQPQTLLNKLRNFVENKYSTSEIYQSNPTIVLELGHIKFELVPAIVNGFSWEKNYKIPAKASSYTDWIGTSPNKFKEELEIHNGINSYLTKPLIRIMKYWNVLNGKVYSSYELEKMILELYSIENSLLGHSKNIISSLSTSKVSSSNAPKVEKLKKQMNKLSEKLTENNRQEAKEILLNIFPEL